MSKQEEYLKYAALLETQVKTLGILAAIDDKSAVAAGRDKLITEVVEQLREITQRLSNIARCK